VKIITGSDLRTGDVIWWTGEGWSRHVNDAVEAGEHADAIIARENAKQIVTDTQVIEATVTDEGVRPAHIKDRIRALGPTVRLDLSLKPADPNAGTWVI
jgi:translation elongation factor P/translation initiation factor 5A